MQVRQINNEQNFNAKFTHEFWKLIREQGNAIACRRSKNSQEYADFVKIIKELRNIKKERLLDTYDNQTGSPVVIFNINPKGKGNSYERIAKGPNMFTKILDFVKATRE